MRRYPSFIAGLLYPNRDGVPCCKAADMPLLLSPGDHVSLERDRDNPHDANAVAVIATGFDCVSHHIGFIPARHSWWVAERLDDDRAIEAIVGEVRRAGDRPGGRIVNIELFLDVPPRERGRA